MARASEELRPGLRAQLESVAAALDLSVGRSRLLVEFHDGSLAWWEPTRVRQPASRLDELDLRPSVAAVSEADSLSE